MKKIKIPWQGVILVVIYLLVTIGFIAITIRNLSAYALAFIVLQKPEIAAKFLGEFPQMMAVSLVLVSVLTFVFVSIGYGKRLGVMFSLVSYISMIISGIGRFFKLLFDGEVKIALMQFVGFFVLFGVLWLAWKCLQYPYYGGDGNGYDFKTWSGWKEFFLGRRNGRVKNGNGKLTTF